MELNIQKNISLKEYTTFKIGGPAKFFVEVKNKEELIEAVEYAKKNNLEFFILAGGSNILISDNGFNGLAIKMEINNYELRIEDKIIESGSGNNLSKIVNESVKNELSGLEWAAGIPGTVGGAVRGNAGAFDGEMKDIVKRVVALDVEKKEMLELSNKECNFSYRNSIFKENRNLIILSVVLQLEAGNKKESQEKIVEIIEKRKEKQPQGEKCAGSFFINPIVENEKLIEEFEKETGMKSKDRKISAGWLIDMVNLRGKKIGGAMTSEKNANYIINFNNAKAEDVIILASFIKQQIRVKFRVQLREEVQYVGF